MKIAIRTDSSIKIGSGHVIRCLTLARALKKNGHNCKFISRNLKGNLNRVIKQEFELEELAAPNKNYKNLIYPPHAIWAEIDWESDAKESISKLSGFDWIICDHYAFDWQWETFISTEGIKIMVIDDLADRHHKCDLLLDATLGRYKKDYKKLTNSNTVLFVGVEYALIRPEFKKSRKISISKRLDREIKNILICMGGMDSYNLIPEILINLGSEFISQKLNVNILISSKANNIKLIEKKISELAFPVKLLIDQNNISEIMIETDIAISACGLFYYELATMSVPTILIPVSDIQKKMAIKFTQLSSANVLLDPLTESGLKDLKNVFSRFIVNIKSNKISKVNSIPKFDGGGVEKVAKAMESILFF